MKNVIYPGSFDPLTNGHLDLIKRAGTLFDKVYVAIAVNSEKSPLFNTEEKIKMIQDSCSGIANVEVINFDGLLVDAVSKYDASAVIRGLRAVTDFEYELQMALLNRELNDKCETIFMTPNPSYTFVSSTIIKEIAKHGGDISPYAPTAVIEALNKKIEAEVL